MSSSSNTLTDIYFFVRTKEAENNFKGYKYSILCEAETDEPASTLEELIEEIENPFGKIVQRQVDDLDLSSEKERQQMTMLKRFMFENDQVLDQKTRAILYESRKTREEWIRSRVQRRREQENIKEQSDNTTLDS